MAREQITVRCPDVDAYFI